MILSKPSERLYLQKNGTQDIYVNLYRTLPQHQINGIRFLFQQFKKNIPGVIVNDPSGYGKCLRVVLFMNALRPVLKKPMLILSDSASYWKEHFQEWTECRDDDLAIETSNPYSKKPIHIAPLKDGLSYGRRGWSVAVLHDQGSARELQSMSLNADYKIWITAHNLKENLRMLASIYEWLYPNQKFNVEDFSAKKDNYKDALQKAILLDAFSEDFLNRSTDYWPVKIAEPHQPSKSPVKPTRKNKDPTGTKVKRSKRRRIDDDTDTDNVTFTDNAKKTDSKNENNNNVKESTDKDVESFPCGKAVNVLQESQDSDGFKGILFSDKVPGEGLDVAIKEIVRQETQSKTSADSLSDTEFDSQATEEMMHYTELNASKIVLVPETEEEDFNTNGKETVILETENSESQSIFATDTWDVSDIIKGGDD